MGISPEIFLHVVRIEVAGKMKLLQKFINMSMISYRAVFRHHFLEAGYVWLVIIHQADHIILHPGVLPVVQHIELGHVPGHHPDAAAVFLCCE